MTVRIAEFDLWKPGYGGSSVSVFIAGTTTLANIYFDEGLTLPAPNPQSLDTMEGAGGIIYGKFDKPIYTASSYYLGIDGIENTGIIRPGFSSLNGVDASAANVTAAGSAYAVPLATLAGEQVNAANFGALVAGGTGVAATNTATIALAIAALPNGGFVNIPAGLYKVNALNIPQGVVIRGQGIDATTLQSVMGAASFTLQGDTAGFRDITLDGNSLSAGSIGISSSNCNSIVLTNVKIERFETGMTINGGVSFFWENLSIINTVTAGNIFGKTNPLTDLLWQGGVISTATTHGLVLSYEDQICQNITFLGVGFEFCVGEALYINGAQNIRLIGCYGVANTKIAKILDDTLVLTPATQINNEAINIQFIGGRYNAGSIEVRDTAQNVIFKDVALTNVTFIMTLPLSNFVVLQNCLESGVVLTGDTTKLVRSNKTQDGYAVGLTTTNVTTKAWGLTLKPGQQVYLIAKVIGKGRNVAQRAVYHKAVSAYRPGSTLAYDTQTANFTPGQMLTGQSSGATARIQADADGGATGTLTLTDIKGTFLTGETIVDDNGSPGSARATGPQADQAAALDSVGVTTVRTDYETNINWNATFAANSGDIELRVTGDTGQTVEWTADVEVKST